MIYDACLLNVGFIVLDMYMKLFYILHQEKELHEQRAESLKAQVGSHELTIIKKENDSLRRYILGLQGELYGAKLAAKYLDKELAGRYVYMNI